MTVVCSSCNATNRLPDALFARRVYRCGSCKSTIAHPLAQSEANAQLDLANETLIPEGWEGETITVACSSCGMPNTLPKAFRQEWIYWCSLCNASIDHPLAVSASREPAEESEVTRPDDFEHDHPNRVIAPPATSLVKELDSSKARLRSDSWSSFVANFTIPKALSILFLAAFVCIGWTYNEIQRDSRQRARRKVQVKAAGLERDIGVILQRRSNIEWFDGKRTLLWRVKIPATNRVYVCEWQWGFDGFSENDGVVLFHATSDSEDEPPDDIAGYIVGIHGLQRGKVASINAWDQERLDSY